MHLHSQDSLVYRVELFVDLLDAGVDLFDSFLCAVEDCFDRDGCDAAGSEDLSDESDGGRINRQLALLWGARLADVGLRRSGGN